MASIGALLVVVFDHYCLNALLPVWKTNEENPCLERHFDRALSDYVASIEAASPEEQESILEASIIRQSLGAIRRLNKIREAVMKENFGEQVLDDDKDGSKESTPMPIMCLRQRLRWAFRDQAKMKNLKHEIDIAMSKVEQAAGIMEDIKHYVSCSCSLSITCQACRNGTTSDTSDDSAKECGNEG